MPEPQSGALTTSPQPPLKLNMAGVVGTRTHTGGFGDLVLPLNYTPKKNGGGGQIRTAEP